MRIAQITTELGPGGAERVVLDLGKALKAGGHLPFVVSLSPPPANRAIPDALAAAGIEAFYLGAGKRSPWRLLRLAALLRELKPDVVHSHLMHPNLLARLLKPFYRKPLLNSVHIADRRPGMRPWFLADRLSFPLCDACSAVSKAAASFHEKALGLPPGTIEVVYNGLDEVEPASPERLASFRKELGFEGVSKIIGSIGRLDPQKGFDILLEMLPELSKGVPAGETWGLVLIGEGPEEQRLSALAANSPGNIKTALPGFRRDAASLMELFDVFAMPSRYEGYGLALVEAMSLGLPVVANDVDSLPELCALYPNGACAAFPSAKAVDELLKAARRERSEPCNLMSVEGMAQAYLKIYERLLGK